MKAITSCNLFEKKMKPLAEKEGIEFKKCADYHFQLRGIFLINVYPSKASYYVQGTNKGIRYHDLRELLDVCLGERNLEARRDVGSRRKPLGDKKPALWERSRLCFVCGQEIAKIEEATIEHKIPLYRGGSNRMDNLGLSHATCNHARGNQLAVERTKDEYSEKLIGPRSKQ